MAQFSIGGRKLPIPKSLAKALESEVDFKDLAGRYGVSTKTLARWRQELADAAKRAGEHSDGGV